MSNSNVRYYEKKVDKKDTIYLMQGEIKKLFTVIRSKRDKALFLIAYRHGLRASEVALLKKQDIDFNRHKIFIWRLKSGVSGEQLLQEDEVKVLRSYIRSRNERDENDILFLSQKGGGIGSRAIDHLMKKYCALGKISSEKAHFHVLRHSIAIHLLDAGADVLFVKDILGHRNIQNTLIYAQYTSRKRDEIHRNLFLTGRIV